MATNRDSGKSNSKANNGSNSHDSSKRSRRRPHDERDNAFNFAAWVVDGATGIVEELRHNDLGLSEEFWEHYYTARHESVLAARAFFDSLLDNSESDKAKKAEKTKRRERRGGIDIDF